MPIRGGELRSNAIAYIEPCSSTEDHNPEGDLICTRLLLSTIDKRYIMLNDLQTDMGFIIRRRVPPG